MAGRVVGVHQNDGPRPRRDGAANSLRIDLPAVIVDERGGLELHVVQHGQKIEERVAGLDGEDFAAGIAEQAKEKAVGLAGAGGQNDLFGRKLNTVARIIIADRLPCAEQAARLRIVVERLGVGERGQQVWSDKQSRSA